MVFLTTFSLEIRNKKSKEARSGKEAEAVTSSVAKSWWTVVGQTRLVWFQSMRVDSVQGTIRKQKAIAK